MSSWITSPWSCSKHSEVQAVDSENSKNLVADGRRRLQILKDLVAKDHYYSKFSTGNAKTLPTGDDEKVQWIRSALLAFHAKHYRPENYTVVIAGPQSLGTLEEWVISRFSQIQENPAHDKESSAIEALIEEGAKDAPPFSYDEPTPAYNSPMKKSLEGSLPILVTNKPLRSMRKLVLMFPMESHRKIPDKSPSSFLSHLLGHEGEGSAFAVLQNHGMISSLSAGSRTSGPDFQLFQVDMELTEKGERNWKEVVDLIFAYCRLINKQLQLEVKGESREFHRIWGETSQLDRIFFDQTSPGGVYAYAPSLCQRIVAYGTEKCLSAGSMLDESEKTFPLDHVVEVAKLLTPDCCFIERCSEEAWAQATTNEEGLNFTKKSEQWYGVEYYTSPIDSKAINSWTEHGSLLEKSMNATELSLPRPNMYIPRTLDLCDELPDEAKMPRIEKPADPPNLLINSSSGRLFHRLDDRYALPQSSFHILIRNAATNHVKQSDGAWSHDTGTGIKSTMLALIFNQAMAQETYDAELAGLYWSMSLGPSGVKLNFFGFSDRLPDLADKISGEFLAGGYLKEAYFVSSKDRVVRGLKTYFSSRRADSNALYYRDALLASKDRTIDESIELAENIDLQSLQDHHGRIVQNDEIYLDCLLTGNVSSTTAKSVFSRLDSAITEASKARQKCREAMSYIPAGELERRILPGEDIELHFQSRNPQEENGAVIVTFQSSVPAFRGQQLSDPLSLQSTSSIRLLCHMLREPLFDELRTKQQLGYIVSAYYENGFSSRQPEDNLMGPSSVPIDFITINILSRKVSPPEVANRIEDFLGSFRDLLEKMPESEIRDHADALSTKLLKPVQKLITEANNSFSKIQLYGPECFAEVGEEKSAMPWKSVEALAGGIQSIGRKELLETWDRMFDPSSRCRIVSCVYGNTFPLEPNKQAWSFLGWNRQSTARISNNFSKLLEHRQRMHVFDNQVTSMGKRRFSTTNTLAPRTFLSSSKLSTKVSLVGLGVVGFAGVVGWTMIRTSSPSGGSARK
eukprot:scaffold1080_cov195-Cylindrotheca_fusiformis.AAC.1